MAASWKLVDEDWSLIANKSGVTRLGFAVLLKFFEMEARFRVSPDEVPAAPAQDVSQQAGADAAVLGAYPLSGQAIERHRSQIRQSFGFREFTRGEGDKLSDWLATEARPLKLREEQLREAQLVRCRTEKLVRQAGPSGSSG